MNEFPYDHLTSFVTKLQHGESFLTSQKIDKKKLQNLIEVVKNQKVEDLKKLISNKEMTANMSVILLHAYWLWYYPFGFKSLDGQDNIFNLLKKSLDDFNDKFEFNDEFVKNNNELAGMGTFASCQHDEVNWILENIFSIIFETSNFEEFKEQFIKRWTDVDKKNSTKNLLLHVLKPCKYEPIAKQDEKTKIVNAFSRLLNESNKNQVDNALSEIRNKLAMGQDENFYNPKYSIYWKNDLSTPAKKLEYKKALVLYGPPGTGKTYTAMEIAKTLIVKYYLSSDVVDNNVIEKCKKYINKTEDDITFRNDEHISYLQFHINYNYEDFIAGQTIEVDSNGKSTVKTKKGFIFDIINSASKNKQAPYIVILDEINRTDISRVFGELFTAIEKRDTNVMLALPDPDEIGKRLCLNIPDNVYFIGTMNEIDFSLERVDFALRRRFVWEYCGYAEDVLKNIVKRKVLGIDDNKIDDFFRSCTNLNKKIEEVLGESYHIGHAFFAEIANIHKQVNDLEEEKNKWKYSKKVLWDISIKPTLDAYCGTMDSGLKEKYLGNKTNKGEFYKAFFG